MDFGQVAAVHRLQEYKNRTLCVRQRISRGGTFIFCEVFAVNNDQQIVNITYDVAKVIGLSLTKDRTKHEMRLGRPGMQAAAAVHAYLTQTHACFKEWGYRMI